MKRIGNAVLLCILILSFVGWSGMARAEITSSKIVNIADLVNADLVSNDGASHWITMESYKIWEANRQIFLYPENWIEPESSGDASAFFEGQVQAVMQHEIASVTAVYRIWKDRGQIFVYPENLLMPASSDGSQQSTVFCSDCMTALDALAVDYFPNASPYATGYLFLTNRSVPEPATTVVFGIGIAGVAVLRRRFLRVP